MKSNEIHTLEKLETNRYFLRKLYLPRAEIQQIRQQEGIEYDDLRSLFEGIPFRKDVEKGRMNFILPDSYGGLCVRTKDMGRDFADRNRYNGEAIEGTREEMMAELRERLRKQGYHFRPNACFRNVDVVETLRKIMEHNTSFYQTDFAYDREMFREAAEDKNAPGKFFWMSRKNGTWCFPERSVHIRQISQRNTWFFHGGSRDDYVKAFWVEIHGMKNDRVMGNVLEIDYQKHLDYLCTHAHDPTEVEVVFRNPNGCRIFDYQEYEQNWQTIADRYGTVERKQYLVEDEYQLTQDVEGAHKMFWDAVEIMEVEDYVARLEHERLYDYGYRTGDLQLIGPMDAERAICQGLECYLLNEDGSKELICDWESYRQALSHGKLFGMTAGEREILEYFKQEAVPLFSQEEMRKIYSLALQAGMENKVGESTLLDGIIHKVECFLPGGEQVDAEQQKMEQKKVIQEAGGDNYGQTYKQEESNALYERADEAGL